MAPDADAGKADQARRSVCAADLGTAAVGDGHEIYVESVGRAGGIPAVYLHGGPGSGCQPDHRRLFDPERFHAVLFDQRGAGRSRPKGRREHNTLPHLIADMEMIREKFGFERWMVVGGSWGATLALAYAQAHPERVTGIVLRATFLGTIAGNRRRISRTRCRASIPASPRISSSLLPPRRARAAAAKPISAASSIPIPPCTARRRAPGTTPSAFCPSTRPTARGSTSTALKSSRALPATPFMEAHYFANDCFMQPDQLLAEAGKLKGIPGIIVQGRYDLLCPPATSHALAARVARGRNPHRRRRRPYAVRSRRAQRGDEGDRGHGVQNQKIGNNKMPIAGKGMLLTSMDIDAADEAEFNRWYDREHLEERVAIDGFLEARRYVAHDGKPKYLSLYSTETFEVLDSPAYRAALANQTAWSKANIARFKNMIRAVARITISRGNGRGAALGIIRLRPAGGEDKLRAALRRAARSGRPRRHHLDASARERSGAVEAAHRRSRRRPIPAPATGSC